MAGYRRLLVILMVVMTTATAVPHTERDGACMAAGELADTLFHELVLYYLPHVNIQDMFSKVLDMDYDNFTFTEVICLLEGVESVDGAMNRLFYSPDQLTFKIYKGLYVYLVVMAKYSKSYMIYDQEFYPTENVPDELDLIRALEASNITNLDPEGVAWMIDVSSKGAEFPDPEPLSTQPIDQQCTDIANILIKIWERMVENGRYGALAGVYYREWLYNNTGFVLPQGPETQPAIERLACLALLWSKDTHSYYRSDLHSLFNFVFYNDYLSFVVSQKYRMTVRHLKRDYLDASSQPQGDNYTYNEDYYDYLVIQEQTRQLVWLLEDLGLLDLQLMTDTHPYRGEPFVNPYY